MQIYSYKKQIDFFRFGKLPSVPKYLENIAKIAIKANKLGIEYCGKSVIAVQKEIEAFESKRID